MDNSTKFFSSGSTMLDLVLGGGWALNRIFNIVGDRSVGKTLIAIEGLVNFKLTFSDGRMRYAEAEAALDESFASQLGFPPEVTRPDKLLNTVEEFRDDLSEFISKGGPGLYILDSLDALSDDAEVKRFKDNDKGGSYGAQKAKEMSELFRLLTREVSNKNCCLGIISQIRDNIGVQYGEHHTRSGGRALDFYASQVLWLHNAGKVERTFRGDKRVTGIKVGAKCKKNKVGLPFRETNFDIIFGYGIDSEVSMLDWLLKQNKLTKELHDDLKKKLGKARETKDYPALDIISAQLKIDSGLAWDEIEDELAPSIRKYVR